MTPALRIAVADDELDVRDYYQAQTQHRYWWRIRIPYSGGHFQSGEP